MKKCLLFLFCFTSVLSAKSQDDMIPYLTSECDTLALVDGIVNVAKGQLVQIDQDIAIEGSDLLIFTRYYDGGHNFSSDLGHGFGFSVPELLICDYGRYDSQIMLEQRVGADVSFTARKAAKDQRKNWSNIAHVADQYYRSGYTNCCEALLRGNPMLRLSLSRIIGLPKKTKDTFF